MKKPLLLVGGILVVGAIVVCGLFIAFGTMIGSSPTYQATSTARAAARPTESPPTAVPSASAVSAPVSRFFAPLDTEGKAGNAALTLERVEFWQEAETTKPKNGLFLVLVGELASIDGKNDCPKAGDFRLAVTGTAYEPSSDMGKFKAVYHSDYPGPFRGQCVTSPEATFIVFDVPSTLGPAQLVFRGTPIELANLETLAQAVGIAQVMPTSTPTPTPTSVPALTATLTSAPAAAVPRVPAQVLRVIDGDTIEVSIDGRTYTVWYIGIDTPDTVAPGQPVEWMGLEASAANRELVEGKIVLLEKDVSETDQFGRLLRYVYVGDMMVNAELVRLGYAQVSTFPPDVKYQDLFLELQEEARDAERGLWGPTPTARPTPTQTPRPATATRLPATATQPPANCDPSYPTVCIPSPPPDLDCGDIPYRNFPVLPPDPHRFDGDHNGIGCET